MVLVDSGIREPASKLRTRAAAERLARRELDRTRCLADDRDAVADGSRDYRASTLEIAGGDALRAGTDARVKVREPETFGVAIVRS